MSSSAGAGDSSAAASSVARSVPSAASNLPSSGSGSGPGSSSASGPDPQPGATSPQSQIPVAVTAAVSASAAMQAPFYFGGVSATAASGSTSTSTSSTARPQASTAASSRASPYAPAASSTGTSNSPRRASSSASTINPGSPARSRLSVAAQFAPGGVRVIPTSGSSSTPAAATATATATATAAAAGAPAAAAHASSAPVGPAAVSTAQLTAAQALAQQPAVAAPGSLFGGLYAPGSLNAGSSSSNSNNTNNISPSASSSGSNNPSTRILSSANLSTPVPSSASSSATFLTGRSQAATTSSQTAASRTSNASHFGPLGANFTRSSASNNTNSIGPSAGTLAWNSAGSGSNTPQRAGAASNMHHNVTFMPGLPLPLTFGVGSDVHGSPNGGVLNAARAHFQGNHPASAGGAGSSNTMAGTSSRASPTPRFMSVSSFPSTSVTPAMVGGVPSGGSASSPTPFGTFPAWYRHPTSGLLPLLEVPSAFLSGGSANAGRPSSHSRTGSTSALLRSSAALTAGTGNYTGAGTFGSNRSSGRVSSSSAAYGSGIDRPSHASNTPNPLHAGPIPGGAMSEDTVVSFSWVIGELALLRDEVERSMPPGDEGRSVSAGAGRNPVWTTQPCFGDPKLPKWKLELVRTQRNRPSAASGDEDYVHAAEGGQSGGTASNSESGDEVPNTPSGRSEGAGSAETPRAEVTTVLSVYLTSLALEYLPSDALIPATIMLGLQPARTTLSRLQSRAGGWLWQEYASFVFKREAEFFECHTLPTLSELLENDEVRAQDAVKLTVQIGCGPGIVGPETEVGDGFGFGEQVHQQQQQPRAAAGGGPGSNGLMLAPYPRLAPFQVPSAHYVSQTILDALEGLVDCARTGDVRIIVRERGLLIQPPVSTGTANVFGAHGDGGDAMSDDGHGPRDFEREEMLRRQQQPYVIPYPVGSYFPLDLAEAEHQQEQARLELSGLLSSQDGPRSAPSASVVVRDRIIWAHSSVLRARSQYFADMIDGGFAEAQDEQTDAHNDPHVAPASSRAIKTFRIPDSEWATVYWLVRYLYLEEIEFADREDVRSAALDNDWMISAEGLFPAAEAGSGFDNHHHHQPQVSMERAASSQVLSGRTAPRPNWEWRTIAQLLQEEEEQQQQQQQQLYDARRDEQPARSFDAQRMVPDDSAGTAGTAPSPVDHVNAAAAHPHPGPGLPASSSSGSSKLNVPSSPSGSWRGHPGTIYSSAHPPPSNSTSSSGGGGGGGGSRHAHHHHAAHHHHHAHTLPHGQHDKGASSSSSVSAGSASTHSLLSNSGVNVGSSSTTSTGGGGGSSAAGTSTATSTTPVPQDSAAARRRASGSEGHLSGSATLSHDAAHGASHPDGSAGPSMLNNGGSNTSNDNNPTAPPPAPFHALHDPHEHPAARAPPASALATYKLAHRYGQVGLAELAKAHIVETLTPQTAFPVLLATALYAGLHEAIKRYVYEHWEEVSHTEEFERCCDEVGAGEWGAEAGRSLRIFMQSLLSPARILLASPQR